MSATEWTPERDRLALDLHQRDPLHPGRVASRLGVDVEELQRRLGVLVASPSARWVHPLPAGHAATWGIITAGTTLEGAAFEPPSRGLSGVVW
jgi:hypothetical protein